MSKLEEYRKVARTERRHAISANDHVVERLVDLADAALAEVIAERDAATAMMQDFRRQMKKARARAADCERLVTTTDLDAAPTVSCAECYHFTRGGANNGLCVFLEERKGPEWVCGDFQRRQP